MIITLGEHRLRPSHNSFTIEYMQHDQAGEPNGRWRERGYYPTNLEHGLARLAEEETKRRATACTELDPLLEVVRGMRDDIMSLCNVYTPQN